MPHRIPDDIERTPFEGVDVDYELSSGHWKGWADFDRPRGKPAGE